MAKRRGRTRRFTPDFKAQAVQLVNESDKTLKEIAKDLGIGHSTLCKWCMAADGRTEGSEIVSVVESPEEELKRLRKRVRELEMEKQILKKAAAFFAKESS